MSAPPASGPGHALRLFLSQVFFTLSLVPLFLWPRFAAARPVRAAVVRWFGRALAGRYNSSVIDFYGGEAYGRPLEAALARAAALAPRAVLRAADCGTGTRFAASRVAARYPAATVLAFDALFEMLLGKSYAPEDLRGLRKVRAESLELPLKDGSVDLAIAHNTTPFLGELARVCRPGGFVLFADSAARWMGPVARFAARRRAEFDWVEAGPAGYGFYLLARRRAAPGAGTDRR